MSLLEPIVLGSRTAPNRIVFGPHETNLAQGRAFSERHVAYYRRRAAGGAGVIVVEEASVHVTDWPYERCPLASVAAPGWSAIAAACQAEGALVIAALGHSGGQGSTAYSQMPLWAPSRVPEVNTREVPKSMEPGDVDELVAGFVAAATAAVEAGCDGVEINVGQFSLLRQFLSGLTNQRGDEWADRPALARRVLTDVRSAIGADRVLGLRLSCDELAPWAGIVPEAGAELAADLAADADYVTVVRGSIFSSAATRPDGHVDPGFNLDLAGLVRTAVRAAHGDRVPVIAQGSIVDPGQAEWAVAEGRCDAVEMTRAQIADADLVAKLAAGTPERVRPCILCNQTCMVRDARNPIITCVVDPRTGHELTEPEPTGSTTAVTIVGGGVAGLEAARVAATSGAAVRVVEAATTTGGMLRTASAGSGRARLALFADWLDAECRRLGVEIETGHAVEAAELGDSSAVIVATGSVASPLSVPATKAAVVLTAAEYLNAGSSSLPAGPILVWDPIGGPIAVSIAEQLGWEGRSVTLATPDNIVGNELSRSGDLAPANARLQQAGVVLERRSILRSVKKGTVVLEDRFTGAQRNLKAAVLIDCAHRLPDEALFRELHDASTGTVVRAGDAVAPRTVLEAVREGRLAVAALDGSVRISDGVPMPRSTHH
ncbi:MAG TPA: mycofactocin system FadH/OYE family oxidoreductase 1 [Microthrixaceae bacterium]|nr:mycofactocin system FadH/OYE family oxidoreductase 1 [Microthrixaceae bacterium]